MIARRSFVLGVVASVLVATTGSAAVGTRVAVLVDTSQGTAASMTFLRSAVASLITGLPEGTEVLLATTGRRLQVRVPPTIDRRKAADSAAAMTSDGGATVLMDGLLEVDERFMRTASDRTSVFVIVTSDGSESSRTDPDAFNAWLRTLPPRGVVAHAVVLKSGNGVPEVVANAIAQATGGRCETIGNAGLLKEKMDALSGRLAVK